MRSVNKVILIGNLTREPEMKQTTGGQMITTFGLATNRQWTSNSQKRNSAEFHEIVTWAKLAEICKAHLRKGMLVYLEGYLKTRSWDMEDGTRRFRTEIVASDMIILERREGDDTEEYTPAEAEEIKGMAYEDIIEMEAPSAPKASTTPTTSAPMSAMDDEDLF